MKKLLLPTLLALTFQAQVSLAENGSDCAYLKKIVVKLEQRVGTLKYEVKLARVNGDGNLKNFIAQYEEALILQSEYEEELEQCQRGGE